MRPENISVIFLISMDTEHILLEHHPRHILSWI